ncbi:PAQR family membrane homeostasis protein TrhA [Deinococcus roseus]|uniref:Hemolysin n=1 Tax=Deinococcus roseus TaxID=392414 RepID=A0ABQ2CVK3_9DEIO|nr:hemolysin III family protein [Deinococcus roseus]GGJ25217.1 hemolysin [Deinococcus roseus]
MLKHLREPINAITHWLGAGKAVILTVLLCIFAYRGGVHWWPFLIFGVSMFLLYLASASYHSFFVKDKVLLWLRKLDHSAIFLLIAGSYTPIAMLALPDKWRLWTMVIVWGVALAGVILKLVTMKLPRWISTVLYLAMGWMSVVLMPQLIAHFSWTPMVWMCIGGLFYSIGAVIYATKKLNPIPGVFGFHEIWHLFVLGGTASHAVTMFYLTSRVA